MKKRLWLMLEALGIFLVFAVSTQAQGNIEIVDQSVESNFRDNITAYLSAEAPDEITQVEFFYRVAGQRATSRNNADFEAGNTVNAEFSINQRAVYFPPGTELEYWWRITDANDNVLKTERETYLYLDNRHDFNTLSNDRLTLYWYNGRNSFGEALFEQANKGLDQLEEDVGITLEQPIRVFIYGSHNDLLDALSVTAQEWTGGVAFSDYGVVIMGVSPNNLDWGLNATTHEMTHLVIGQATENPYGDMPRWLDEGIAVYNEDPERLDSQFRSSFEGAVASDSLMSLQTLSSTFPADPDKANLAYGESGAVVKFIIDTYGTDAIKYLLEVFSEGSIYDDALEEALGVDMRGLDNAWRASLGLPPLPGIEQEEPVAQEAGTIESQPEVENAASEAEAAPPAAEENAAPEVEQAAPEATATQGPKANENNSGLVCLPGLIPLLALGMVFYSKRKNIRN